MKWGLALIALVAFAVPTVPAIQDWSSDAIRKGCRELSFPKPVSEKLCAVVERAIAGAAAPSADAHRALRALADGDETQYAAARAREAFEALRRVADIRDRARGDAYGLLPERNRLRALMYVEGQSRKSRGKGPAGWEAAIAWLRKDGGAQLAKMLGAGAMRRSELDAWLAEFGDDRRALREKRDALFARSEKAVRAVAPPSKVAALVREWEELDEAGGRVDREQLAVVERELTLSEKRTAARELGPAIDRGLRWAAVYFKFRGTFNAREKRASEE